MRNKTLLLHDASFISIRHSDYLYYDFITFVCLWLRVWSDNWILAVRLNVTFMPVAFRQMQLEKMAFRQVRLEEILPQRSRTQCCEFRCTLLLARTICSFIFVLSMQTPTTSTHVGHCITNISNFRCLPSIHCLQLGHNATHTHIDL